MKNKEQPLTIDRIKNQSSGDIYSDIKFAESFYPEYPSYASKPHLKKGSTSKEAKEYAVALEKWEREEAEFKNNLIKYNEEKNLITDVIEEYIKEMSGLNKIPQKAQSKVWSKAWEDGHSNGYGEVYQCLMGLVDLFD